MIASPTGSNCLKTIDATAGHTGTPDSACACGGPHCMRGCTGGAGPPLAAERTEPQLEQGTVGSERLIERACKAEGPWTWRAVHAAIRG